MEYQQELSIIKQLCDVLEKVNPEVRKRILLWLNSKYAIPTGSAIPTGAFDLNSLATDKLKILALGQLLAQQGRESFTARDLTELGHKHGLRFSNTAKLLADLLKAKPALIQLLKQKSVRQAKSAAKLYKLTTPGANYQF